MQLRDDFAKHISELNNPLERPYSKGIDTSLLQSIDDIKHLNKEIQDVNPDYMAFLSAYFWYFYFIISWTYFASFMFFIISIDEMFRLETSNMLLFLLDIFILLYYY